MEERLARVDTPAENLKADVPQLHRVRLLSQGFKKGAGKSRSTGTAWLYGPFGNPLDDQLAGAAARELEAAAGDLNTAAEISLEQMLEAFWRNFATDHPELAARFGYSMQSIGDGGRYLGEILEADNHNGSCLVEILHPDHGRMEIRQERENPRGAYRGTEVSFVDPETGEWVRERLRNSHFVM